MDKKSPEKISSIEESLVTDLVASGEEVIVEKVPITRTKRGVFPTWADLLAILGLFLLSQLLTKFIFAALSLDIPVMSNVEEMADGVRRAAEFSMGRSIFLWSIIAQPMMLIMVLVYRQFRGGKLWGKVNFSMRGFDPTILLWGVLMLFSLVIVIEPLMELLPSPTIPSGRGVYMLIALIFVAPIFEELLCRGVIFEAIRAKRGAWAACVLSSMIFGLMHLEPQSVLNAFLVGLLMCYLYLRTRSIFAPIVLHALNNTFAYLLLIFGLSDNRLSDFVGGGTLYVVIYSASAVILLLSAVAISRHITRLDKRDREKEWKFSKQSDEAQK